MDSENTTRTAASPNDLQKKPSAKSATPVAKPAKARKREQSALRNPRLLINLASPDCYLRLPGESGVAFDGFKLYRDADPAIRRLADVGKALGKSQTLVERWSSAWAWVERAVVWDNYQQRLLLEQRAHDQVAARSKMKERHISISMVAQQKMVAYLQTLVIQGMGMAELMRSIRIAVNIEVESRGEPTEETEETLALAVSGRTQNGEMDLARLSDKDLRTLEIIVEKATCSTDRGSGTDED